MSCLLPRPPPRLASPREERFCADVIKEAVAACKEARLSRATQHLGSLTTQNPQRDLTRHCRRLCNNISDLDLRKFSMPFMKKW
eukprot:1201710-Pyramimonas_sp.AAC.1